MAEMAESTVKHPFPLTPHHPIEMYKPSCDGCFRCQPVLRMSNILYSPISKWILVWIPKCACSSLRQFFLKWQRQVNPWAFTLTHTELSYHHIYRKRTYQYGYHFPNYNINKGEEPTLTIVIRHPFRRFMSYFIQKHVIQKDIKIFREFSMRLFRLELDSTNKKFTMRTLLRYLNQNGCIDIHDCPFVCQIPKSFIPFLINKNAHVLDSDDPIFWKSMKIQLEKLKWFQTSKRSFREFENLFQTIPHFNSTPFSKNIDKKMQKKDVCFWDWPILTWRDCIQNLPSYLWFENIWKCHADDEIKTLFHSLYGQDIAFYQKYCQHEETSYDML